MVPNTFSLLQFLVVRAYGYSIITVKSEIIHWIISNIQMIAVEIQYW